MDPIQTPASAQVPPVAEPEKKDAPKADANPPAATPKADAAVPAAGQEPAKEPAKKDGEPGGAQAKEPQKDAVLKIEDVKLPDGAVLDQKALAEIIEFANANKLSKEAAQLMAEHRNNAIGTFVKDQEAKLSQMREEWHEQAKNDKEIGGPNFDKNIEVGHRVFKRFGTPGLGELLEKTGAIDHPEVVRFFARLGNAFAPGELVDSANPSDQNETRLADRLYEKTNKDEKAA